MKNDPIVEEIREIRLAIERKCGDREGYFKRLRAVQDEYRDRIRRLEPTRGDRKN